MTDWRGGDCPVPSPIVSVTRRTGHVETGPAHGFDWQHFGVDDDIINYEHVGIAGADVYRDLCRGFYKAAKRWLRYLDGKTIFVGVPGPHLSMGEHEIRKSITAMMEAAEATGKRI